MCTDEKFEANSRKLLREALKGNLKQVQRLIPVSDPKYCDSMALHRAAGHGHVECVKLLIPFSDPKSHFSEALYQAAFFGHKDVVEVLIAVSDVDEAIHRLVKIDHEDGIALINNIQAELQQRSLDDAIADNYANARDGDKRLM